MTFTNDSPANTYARLIQLGGTTNSGVGTTPQNLQDGLGNDLPVGFSTTSMNYSGNPVGNMIFQNTGSFVPSGQLFNLTKTGYAPYLLLFDGDSRTQSYAPAAGYGYDFVTQLLALSGWRDRGSVVNLAVSSATIATAATEATGVLGRFASVATGTMIYGLFGAQNDLSAGRTSAQISSDLSGIWNIVRNSGQAQIIAFTEPSTSGGMTTGTIAERNLYNSWVIANSGILYNYLVDLSDLNNSNTIDNTHFNAAGNAIVASRINAAVGGQPWGKRLRTAGAYQGTISVQSQGQYEPAIIVSRNSLATRNDGTNAESALIQTDKGVKYFPCPPPILRGISIGDNGNSSAQLLSSISLGTGDFTVYAWVRTRSRLFSSGSNTGIILCDVATSTLFGFVAGATGGTPYVLANGNNYVPTNSPKIKTGQWHFVAWVRTGTKLTVYVDGAASAWITCSESITVSRPFGDTGSQAYFNGFIGEIGVKTTAYTQDQLEVVMRGGSFEKANTSVSASLWMTLRDGAGYALYDLSANKNNFVGRDDNKKIEWLFPSSSLRVSATTSGTQSIFNQKSFPSNFAFNQWLISATGSSTINLGTTSGSFDIISGFSVLNGLNNVPITGALNTSSDTLYLNQNNNFRLSHVILGNSYP